MNRFQLISSILVILTEAVGAFEDGKITGDEVIRTFEIAMRMFGVDTSDPGFNFNVFIETDGDVHFVLKADFVKKIFETLSDALS